jgi:hypothetical protein
MAGRKVSEKDHYRTGKDCQFGSLGLFQLTEGEALFPLFHFLD